ncbi:pyruvate dehydrogenase E1 component alpha subunit [Sedimentibacter acidaminivorans]|uniref:Pyruvate dehydrogenase E1 component alpha subunit n=1 Tax=Sedimentibacter acidaminivorans TaxID=913099 RepID=A0ABS4GHD0_9FIRM|nr:thiamine pyrophosphate-dependent dehydrogenase E1 component subunit alpha [Sedimentibacter acidaminivorans]MBP1927104.1 pyruvate dehydrogenase E1 component alpha subunit [Sedimentibacter acidaminivorans]
MAYSKNFLIDIYEELVELRLFEEKLVEIYNLGKVPGHIHSGVGEEATYVGTLATRKDGDYYKITHRPVGASAIIGVPLNTIFSEIMGKRDGNSGGRGGVNHVSLLSKGMLGFSGTLACDIAVGVGAGLTIKKKGTDNIVYVYYGDGTSSRGPVHEAMNLAAVWQLPVLFICENNQFAISTHATEGISVENPGADRAAGYGMPSKIVDGTDVLSVYEGAKELTDYIRSGKGPAILEAKSYRWRGHFEGDQARYRDAGVTEEWKRKDCVEKMKKYICESKVATQEEINAICKKINDDLDKAIKFADESQSITVEEIYEYMYVK